LPILVRRDARTKEKVEEHRGQGASLETPPALQWIAKLVGLCLCSYSAHRFSDWLPPILFHTLLILIIYLHLGLNFDVYVCMSSPDAAWSPSFSRDVTRGGSSRGSALGLQIGDR